jgi:hypothetical protein
VPVVAIEIDFIRDRLCPAGEINVDLDLIFISLPFLRVN